MKTSRVIALSLGFVAVCASAPVSAQTTANDGHGTAAHILFTPEAAEWGPGPASLPPGSKAIVIEGNPAEAGPFTLRLALPARYKIAPHHHPADEHITVISGTFHMGIGEAFDHDAGHAMTPGAFAMMKAGTRHFVWTGDEEAVIQLHGVGPWGITYVNAADDPRNQL